MAGMGVGMEKLSICKISSKVLESKVCTNRSTNDYAFTLFRFSNRGLKLQLKARDSVPFSWSVRRPATASRDMLIWDEINSTIHTQALHPTQLHSTRQIILTTNSESLRKTRPNVQLREMTATKFLLSPV